VHEPFEEQRPFLTRFAYRLLGTVQDAEDAVQDAYLRWERSGRPDLDEPRAWFLRTVARLCLDQIRRARTRAAGYEGEWLPEPWDEEGSDAASDPDAVSAALLVALHRLRPAERAVFLLHDIFDYSFAETGAALDLETAHCRQLAVRARGKLKGMSTRPGPDRAEEERLAAAFFRALRDGDLSALEELLHQDVVLRADGGGKVTAVHYPLEGRARVLRFLDRIFVRTRQLEDAQEEPRSLHAGPARLLWRTGRLESVFMFGVDGGRIVRVLVQRNPDKLARLQRSEPGKQSSIVSFPGSSDATGASALADARPLRLGQCAQASEGPRKDTLGDCSPGSHRNGASFDRPKGL